jgi:hypothetical protein
LCIIENTKTLHFIVEGEETWYHGTIGDHAQSIINIGIDMSRGERFKDFSHAGGFYLQDNLKSAIKWSQILAGNGVYSAVVIYRFNSDDLKQKNWVGQEIFGLKNRRNWIRVVQFYR